MSRRLPDHRRRTWLGRLCSIAGIALLGTGGLALAGDPAAAAQTKAMTVTPATGLADGQEVDVHVTGAAPNELLVLFECNTATPGEKTAPAPNALTQCVFASGKYKTANADASGVLDTKFTAFTGTVTSLGNQVTIGDTAHLFVTNTTEVFADGPPTKPLSFSTTPPPVPTAQVTPSSDLEDGDVVTVSWTGFPAGTAVGVTQCTGTVNPTGQGQCDLDGFVQGTSDAAGAGTVQFTVGTGPTGDGGGVCDADHDCVLLVADFGGVARAVDVIEFAAPPAGQTKTMTVTPSTDLEDGDVVDVHVTGAAPNELLVIFECNTATPGEKTDPAPNALTRCVFASGKYTSANADAAGVLDTTFTVLKGTFSSLGNDVTIGDQVFLFVSNTTETFADQPPVQALSFAPASAGPQVTITPSTDLEDGDVVTVSWTGYPAGQAVGVTQCTGTVDPTEQGQCDLDGFVQQTSDAAGAGSVQFTVAAGPVGEGGGTCDADHDCVILVADFGSVARGVGVIAFAGGPASSTTSTTSSSSSTTSTSTTAPNGSTTTTGAGGTTSTSRAGTGGSTTTVAAGSLPRTGSSALGPLGLLGIGAIVFGAGLFLQATGSDRRRA